MRRPLIVGEAPSRDGKGKIRPLDGKSGARLEQILRIAPGTLPRYFRLANLLQEYEDRFPPRHVVRVRACVVRRKHIRRGDVIFLLGRNVAMAFGFSELGYFEEAFHKGSRYYVIPHPSGRSRVFNDWMTRERAAKLLTSFISGDLICAE